MVRRTSDPRRSWQDDRATCARGRSTGGAPTRRRAPRPVRRLMIRWCHWLMSQPIGLPASARMPSCTLTPRGRVGGVRAAFSPAGRLITVHAALRRWLSHDRRGTGAALIPGCVAR
jgi:hypothetical protein